MHDDLDTHELSWAADEDSHRNSCDRVVNPPRDQVGLWIHQAIFRRSPFSTEDGYTTLEQRLYPVLRNDLGPLISSNHGDLLTEIKDSRGIYKGVVRVPHISLCLDMSLSGI